MKIGRITQLSTTPLQCSQGGVPFNLAHLEASQKRIAELEAEVERLREFLDEVTVTVLAPEEEFTDTQRVNHLVEAQREVRARRALPEKGDE